MTQELDFRLAQSYHDNNSNEVTSAEDGVVEAHSLESIVPKEPSTTLESPVEISQSSQESPTKTVTPKEIPTTTSNKSNPNIPAPTPPSVPKTQSRRKSSVTVVPQPLPQPRRSSMASQRMSIVRNGNEQSLNDAAILNR